MHSLVSGELSEHEVLISVAFVLLDQQIVGGCDRVVLVVLDLGSNAAVLLSPHHAIHLYDYLVQNRDVIFANDYPIKLCLAQLCVPLVLQDVLNFVACLGISEEKFLDQVFAWFFNVARD